MSNNTTLFTQMLETPLAGNAGIMSSFQGGQTGNNTVSFFNLLVGMMRPSVSGLDNNSGIYGNQHFERDSFLQYWLDGAFDEVDANNLSLVKDKTLSGDKDKKLSPEQLSALLGIQPQQLLNLLKTVHQSDSGNKNDSHSRNNNKNDFDISIQNVLKHDIQPTALPLPNLNLTQLQNLVPALPQPVQRYTSENQFSEEFTSMLQKAYSQRQSIRVALSDETAVVLKFNADGKVSAHFLTNSAADEWRLKQHLNDLQQRLDAKALPYDELTVNPDGQRRQNDRGNQE